MGGPPMPLSPTEIRFLHIRILQETFRQIGFDHAAGLQNVTSVGKGQRLLGVLLDEKNRGAGGVVVADDLENLADDQWRQSQRRFVQKLKLGPAHQGAPDGQHLLLAAGKRARLLIAPLSEHRELLENVIQILVKLDFGFLLISTEQKILARGEIGKYLTPLGAMAYSQANDLMWRQIFQADIRAVEFYCPAGGS
jgi:hypothetical protein